MRPVLLYRRLDRPDSEEEAAMAVHFPVIRQRTLAGQGDLVIPRYCSLPFGKELEEDIRQLGGQLTDATGLPVYFSVEENSGRSHDCPGWVAHVLDVEPTTAWEIHDKSYAIRKELRDRGVLLTIMTHTVEATTRLYPWVREV